MTGFKKFKVYAPPNCKELGLNDDGTLTITGIASTTNEDLDGEIISADALKSLAKQVKGLNLHIDHNHYYDGGIGVITDAGLERNYLKITAIILSEYAKGVLERLTLGMNFGFSIGGIPVMSKSNHKLIDDFKLLEVSLTLLPANWDTFGTVEIKNTIESKCFSGACNYILKNKGEIMVQKNKKVRKSKKNLDGTPQISEDVKRELVNIVNEAVYNLTPIVVEKIRGELDTIVQEVVSASLMELLPDDAGEEIIAEEEVILDEEEIEEFEQEEELLEEKDETDEEIIEEEKAGTDEEEVEDEEEVVGVLDEEIIEEEKEVTDDPVDGIDHEDEEVDYAGDDVELKPPINPDEIVKEIVKGLDTKALADSIIKQVKEEMIVEVKENNKKKVKKSKLKQYSTTKTPTKKHKFLDSDKRDKYGRNKKYL